MLFCTTYRRDVRWWCFHYHINFPNRISSGAPTQIQKPGGSIYPQLKLLHKRVSHLPKCYRGGSPSVCVLITWWGRVMARFRFVESPGTPSHACSAFVQFELVFRSHSTHKSRPGVIIIISTCNLHSTRQCWLGTETEEQLINFDNYLVNLRSANWSFWW